MSGVNRIRVTSNGPARTVHIFAKSDTFNEDGPIASAFYAVEPGNISFFDAAGEVKTIPVAAYQTIICICRGVRETYTTAGIVIGYIT